MSSQLDHYLLIPEGAPAHANLTTLSEIGRDLIEQMAAMDQYKEQIVPARAEYNGRTVGFTLLPAIDENNSKHVDLLKKLEGHIQDTFARYSAALTGHVYGCFRTEYAPRTEGDISFMPFTTHAPLAVALYTLVRNASAIGMGNDILTQLQILQTEDPAEQKEIASRLSDTMRSEAKFFANKQNRAWIVGYNEHSNRGDLLKIFDGSKAITVADVKARMEGKGVTWDDMQPSHEKARQKLLKMKAIKLTL